MFKKKKANAGSPIALRGDMIKFSLNTNEDYAEGHVQLKMFKFTLCHSFLNILF